MNMVTPLKNKKNNINQKSNLPKAVKKVLLRSQAKLKSDLHISNNLSRLLDAECDCI